MNPRTGPVRVEEWIAGRTPPPPPALSTRLAEVARLLDEGRSGSGARHHDTVFQALIAGAEAVLRSLPAGRGAAIDLLAADALISYAFEAATDDCDRLGANAEEAMQRIAGIASRDREA